VSGVKQIVAGAEFTVALRSNGEVWTWGANNYGQLGDGTHTDRATPARNPVGYGMTQVSAGGFYALALAVNHMRGRKRPLIRSGRHR
jgi:alpha-tubulin suppressor-like RCC1 family protein